MTAYTFTAPLERWDARAADSWFFVFLPEGIADEIAALPLPPAGFGSVKVHVTVGAQTWSTSVFPSTARGTYSLPIKRQIRMREGLEEGGPVDVTIEIVR